MQLKMISNEKYSCFGVTWKLDKRRASVYTALRTIDNTASLPNSECTCADLSPEDWVINNIKNNAEIDKDLRSFIEEKIELGYGRMID